MMSRKLLMHWGLAAGVLALSLLMVAACSLRENLSTAGAGSPAAAAASAGGSSASNVPSSAAPTHPTERQPVPNRLYEKVRQASVKVLVHGRLNGSGWFADGEGLIVTAAHVVRDSPGEVEVVLSGGRRVEAELVAIDCGHDIALMRIAPPSGQPYPSLKVTEQVPQAGDDVFVFGSAQFRHELMLRGTLASPRTAYEYHGEPLDYVRVLHVAATAPKGTSGGCWVDRQGRVVGNQSGYMIDNGSPVNISYMAPPDALRRLIEQRTSAQTPTLGMGVEELWEQPTAFIAKYPRGSSGVVAKVIAKEGPAAEAGVEVNDLIISVDGEPLSKRDDLLSYVRDCQPGAPVSLIILQPDGQRREVRLWLTRLEPRQVTQAIDTVGERLNLSESAEE